MKAPDRLRGSARLLSAIEVRDAAKPKSGPWLTRNISTGGVFVLAPKLWKRGDRVALELIDAQETLDIEAIVTHVDHEGVGLQFADVPQEMHERLSNFICARIVSGESFAERRRELRWKTKIAARLRARSEEHPARVLDLNTSGARLQSTLEVEAGASLYFLLPVMGVIDEQLPPPAIMGTQATVVYATQDGFAINFLDPSDEFKRAVLSLLAST